MSARVFTPDEERRYDLPPLPDVPWIGAPASERLNRLYEENRVRYVETHPHRDMKGLRGA